MKKIILLENKKKYFMDKEKCNLLQFLKNNFKK